MKKQPCLPYRHALKSGLKRFDDLWNTAYEATLNLDKVIDINYYPTDEAKLSNTKHRPIGLGIQGLADALVKMKIPFDSDEAVNFSEHMMETIYHAALEKSNELNQFKLRNY